MTNTTPQAFPQRPAERCDCHYGNGDHSDRCTATGAWDTYKDDVDDALYQAFEGLAEVSGAA